MQTIAFIGLGLIGGSMARSVRENRLYQTILAYDQNIESIELALAEHVIDEGYTCLNDRLQQADLVVIATPVHTITAYIEKMLPYLSKDCTITDVGSTKSHIISYVNKSDEKFHFVAGHPMAGTEKVGFEFSTGKLFENAKYLLIKTNKTFDCDFEKVSRLAKGLGAIPTAVPFEYHDKLVAAISHTPHIVAAALVNLVAGAEMGGFMRDLVAGGFKDTTRIASSGAQMWSRILLDNSDEILQSLSDFKQRIQKVEENIKAQDYEGLMEFFSEAKKYRDSIIEG